MKTLIAIIIIILIAVGAYFLLNREPSSQVADETADQMDKTDDDEEKDTQDKVKEEPAELSIGTSAEGRDIMAYNYSSSGQADGGAKKHILFIGGIHGGYSWNTSLVAYELMEYLDGNKDVIPDNVKVTVIPALNPDGLYSVTGNEGAFTAEDVTASQEELVAARFNAHGVDLNRNFDCDWQAEGTWQNTPVSGGGSAFSEPESKALKQYVEKYGPDAVVVWYSAAGGVFASNCHSDVLPETTQLTNIYAEASGYKAYESFDFYAITGDAVNWLAKQQIPAISVLLSNHTDTEWSKNKAGIDALLQHYGN